MKNGLWGHALLLASKMDSRTHARVMTRYRLTGRSQLVRQPRLGSSSRHRVWLSQRMRGLPCAAGPRPVHCSVLSSGRSLSALSLSRAFNTELRVR